MIPLHISWARVRHSRYGVNLALILVLSDFPRYYLKEDSGPQANYITTDRV